MRFRYFLRKMSNNATNKLINNAEIAENRLAELKTKLEEVKKFKVEEKILKLTQENQLLLNQVKKAQAELIRLETQNGKKQYPLPDKTAIVPEQNSIIEKKEKKEKVAKINKNKPPQDTNTDAIVDIRRLDLRIGKIVEIMKHPDADSLYVEKIDCGEENPRTVISGLVNHIPIDKMEGKIVMVLCNLKPAKMRGYLSEAMVMCASTPEKTEVLNPPTGASPGDIVLCEGYPREPDAQLKPNKKIFETCAPDLKTNDKGVACYKGSCLIVPGKGFVTAPTLTGAPIK